MNNTIFVFGSNLAGRHGKGAALYAKQVQGAKQEIGVGRSGNSYAIPTKDEKLRVLSISEIRKYIGEFCQYATESPLETFVLTPIGTGLAGIPKRTIAGLFKHQKLPSNVYLTSTWIYEDAA